MNYRPALRILLIGIGVFVMGVPFYHLIWPHITETTFGHMIPWIVAGLLLLATAIIWLRILSAQGQKSTPKNVESDVVRSAKRFSIAIALAGVATILIAPFAMVIELLVRLPLVLWPTFVIQGLGAVLIGFGVIRARTSVKRRRK